MIPATEPSPGAVALGGAQQRVRRPEGGPSEGESFAGALGRAGERERVPSGEPRSRSGRERVEDHPAEEKRGGAEGSVADAVGGEARTQEQDPKVQPEPVGDGSAEGDAAEDGAVVTDARPVEGRVREGGRVPGKPMQTPGTSGTPGAPPTNTQTGEAPGRPEALGGATGATEPSDTEDGGTPTDGEPKKVRRAPLADLRFVRRDRDEHTRSAAVDAPAGEAHAKGESRPAGREVAAVRPEPAPQPATAQSATRSDGGGAPVGAASTGGFDASGQPSTGGADQRQAGAETGARQSAGVDAPRSTEGNGVARVEAAPVLKPAAGVEAGGPGRAPGAQRGVTVGAGLARLGAEGGTDARVEGAVVRGFTSLMRQHGGSVVIRLIPETLGPLRITMKMDGGSVSVSMDATTQQAHELLSGNLGSLRQSLESQGLRVDRVGVTLAHATHSGPGLAADGAAQQRGSEDPGSEQDAADGRSRGHADGGTRDRRGGDHADPSSVMQSFSEAMASSGESWRLAVTA